MVHGAEQTCAVPVLSFLFRISSIKLRAAQSSHSNAGIG